MKSVNKSCLFVFYFKQKIDEYWSNIWNDFLLFFVLFAICLLIAATKAWKCQQIDWHLKLKKQFLNLKLKTFRYKEFNMLEEINIVCLEIYFQVSLCNVTDFYFLFRIQPQETSANITWSTWWQQINKRMSCCFFFFFFCFWLLFVVVSIQKAKNQTLALSNNETPKNIKIVVDATGKKKYRTDLNRTDGQTIK